MGGVVKAVGGAVGGALGGIGGLAGGLLGKFGGTPEEAQAEQRAEEDRKREAAALAQAKATTGTMAGQAQAYRKNMPASADTASGLTSEQRRLDLARQLQSNAAGASARGLLYSGLKQNADQMSAADYAGNMANDRARINQEMESRATGMEDQAIQQAQKLQELESKANAQAYKDALAQRQQRMQEAKGTGAGIGSVFGSAGSGVGGALGGLFG